MKRALILVDIQNDYFENGAMPLDGAEKACRNAKLILKSFRKENLPVIHIQHIALRPTSTFFLPNTKGVEIHASIQPIGEEKTIVKHFPNSFIKTEFLDYLKNENISDLVICGMMTQMCVDATVRAAKDFGFNITLIGDACATKDLEFNGKIVKAKDVQNSFLSALSYFYSTVETTNAYLIGKN